MARNKIEQALHESNFATKEDLEILSKKVDALVKQAKKWYKNAEVGDKWMLCQKISVAKVW